MTSLLLALLLNQNGVSVTNRTVDRAVAVRCVTPDGGGFESCGGTVSGGTVNNTTNIGTLLQGAGADGGQAWNVSGQVAVTNFPASQAVTGSFWPGTQPVSGAVTATQGAGEDGGRAWNVAGAVAVSNFPATQAVSVASLPTTAVTGPLTDTQLRAVAVPVSAASLPTHAVTQGAGEDGGRAWNVAGTVAVSNFPATQAVSLASAPTTPVTGTFWQTTQPVSLASAPTTAVTGTFWQTTQPVSGPLTDTQLRATAVPVSLTSTTITGTAAVTQSGTWTVQPGNTANTTAWKVDGSAVTQPVSLTSTTLTGTVAATQSGTWSDRVVGSAGAAFDAANNAAAPANVVVTGLETIAQGTQPTAATAANVRRQLASTEGVAYVQEGNSNRFSCFVQGVSVLTQCQAAPGAGLRAYVTSVHLSNQAATVQTLDVVFGTGSNCATGATALTHKWQMGTNATTTSPQSVDATFPTPLIPTAANAICVRPSAATAFGATLTGYVAP